MGGVQLLADSPLRTHAGPAMAALAGYCVTTAVSATWVSFSFTGISGPALTFVTFVLAQAVYTARAGRGVKTAWRFAVAHRGQVLLLNVLTLASWLFMFMALQRIEASVESAVYQGSVALVGFLVAGLVAGERFSLAVRVGALAAGAALVLLIAVRVVSTADTPSANPSVGTGIVLALVAGTTGGFYIFCSSRLHRDTGVSANTVLCSRFLLLLAVTGAFSAHEVLGLLASDPVVIGRLLALSVVFVVLPTFLLQYAIAHLPSVRVSAATPLVPVIALGAEYAVQPWGSAAAPAIVVAASAALIFTNTALARGPRATT
ncbi:hypothetical protein ABGB12_10220 [Actinocorallia sp. B10E7]|uniref:hypothetical protein n=1 Tax=Actinocorallia sp. B10E7 TaxID=3153558 RepID=UPI00325DD4C0